MRCGSKCFLVEVEINGEKRVKTVNSRTPVDARKTIRNEYGKGVTIISVKKQN
ncbi:MAG: hypothetical protein LRY73_18985 [Bacillus sp. (in: Bacteria)]|nr:hypothetical protein [Bacillus sp. (in: firmicutes)]